MKVLVSAEGEVSKKKDIKAFLAVIPPAEALRKQRKPVQEKRIRLRYNPSVKSDTLYINPMLARELNIDEYVEISVHGKRIKLKVIINEDVPQEEVWGSSDLKSHGISDNSIVTLRAAR